MRRLSKLSKTVTLWFPVFGCIVSLIIITYGIYNDNNDITEIEEYRKAYKPVMAYYLPIIVAVVTYYFTNKNDEIIEKEEKIGRNLLAILISFLFFFSPVIAYSISGGRRLSFNLSEINQGFMPYLQMFGQAILAPVFSYYIGSSIKKLE